MNMTPANQELYAYVRDLEDETVADQRHLIIGWRTMDARMYGEMYVPIVVVGGVAKPLQTSDRYEVSIRPR